MASLSLAQTFSELDQLLSSNQDFWRFEPFQASRSSFELPPSWQVLNPFLDSLQPHDIAELKEDQQKLLAVIADKISDLSKLWDYCHLNEFATEASSKSDHHNVGIPGRKWQQINAMGKVALQVHQPDQSWLEWCSGKGYLGQWLARESNLPVVSFEWQEQLCEAGQAMADKQQLPMQFVQGDALSESCISVFKPNQHAVALHACGDLHAHLIEHVCQQELPAVTLSPCCYHLIQTDKYQPLSQLGQQAQLQLSKSDLRIPLQETVTGGERVTRHREQEMSFRLGLDLLLQQEFAQQTYIPVPSIKKSQLSLGFAAFCEWAKQQKQWQFDFSGVDFDFWLRQGQKRFWQMEKLSLMQQVFRRPLEMWLVCDKALRLEEAGYKVQLGTFCQRDITPRNIIIQAVYK
ncbi:MAG: methyltransferase [Vibrio sp.]